MRVADGKAMSSGKLQENILSTYFTLRLGIIVLAFALPVLLYVGGRVWGGIPDLPGSMSAYYGENGGTMRDWFVGILCTVGAFLYLYKGFSPLENILLNLAGGFAVGVAMIPCSCWHGATMPGNKLHVVSAVSFFIAMASVAFFCAGDTLNLLPDEAIRKAFRRRYTIISIVLILSPAAAIATSYLLQVFDSRTFFIEAFGVWTFGYYWLTKSREFRITAAEQRAVCGTLEHIPGRGVIPATTP